MPNMRTYPQKARERITGTKIIERLVQHVMGEIELTATQVRAASVLLSKVLPDLKAVEMTSEVFHKPVAKMTDAELQAIIQAGLNRTSAETTALSCH